MKCCSGDAKALALLDATHCLHSCGCPAGFERMPPTPYPPPPYPAVPNPLWAGDLRMKGNPLLPTPTPPGPPPPPPPPVPPAPLGDFSKVGMRFLPDVAIPKGMPDESMDLDYLGNPVTRFPPPAPAPA